MTGKRRLTLVMPEARVANRHVFHGDILQASAFLSFRWFFSSANLQQKLQNRMLPSRVLSLSAIPAQSACGTLTVRRHASVFSAFQAPACISRAGCACYGRHKATLLLTR